jgi:hypothetical protein
MDQTLMLGWSRAAAMDARATYRRVLGLVLALEVLLGLAALLAPHTLADVLGTGEPWPPAWPRLWGGMLLAAAVLYLPGWLDPVRTRWPNLAGLGVRLAGGIVLLLLGGSFAVLGAIALLVGLLLAWAYLRLFRAEIMSRP